MSKHQVLSGRKFGKLTVIEQGPIRIRANGSPVRQSICECECGTTRVVDNFKLTSGHTKSCGCQRRITNTQHGHSKRGQRSRTYEAWKSIRRTRSLCAAWEDSYAAFLADVGEIPPTAYTLDVIDPKSGFTPGNVRWVGQKERSATIVRERQTKLIGRRFAKLIVLDLCEPVVGSNGYPITRVICRCDCGVTRPFWLSHLYSGGSRSCGCARVVVHGHSRRGKLTPEYRSWQAMMARCHRKGYLSYKDYGAKGIAVCERWHTFANFVTDMGLCPSGRTLDRFPNNGGNYEPGNCRWATRFEQAENKSSIRKHTIRGFTGCLAAICRHFGANYNRAVRRINQFGWDIESAIFKPSHGRRG